ncbi:MAG TPA: sensor histidine kinase, partial [Kribbellaceae bacterium]
VVSSRPVPWVAPLLYGAVLVAGLYAWLAGLGDTRALLFVTGLAGLFTVELAERRRYPAGTPVAPAIALLAVRFALTVVAALADGSGLAAILLVLLPFAAYFAFGRTVAIALGAGCVALVLARIALAEPRWYDDLERVSDLLMIAVGVVLAITMAGVAAEAQRGREELRRYAGQVAALSAATERNRVARDLHDSLGHHLTALSILLEQAAAFADRDPATARRALEDAQASARQALDDVRDAVRMLRADAAPFRLSTALAELVRQPGTGARPAVTLDLSGDELGYDEPALLALYRAAQEGLTNARRHAAAGTVEVTVRLDEREARLEIADDGRGFTPGQEGFGLLGMRERVELAGGRVALDSGPGAGTRLVVTIPVPA